MGSGEPGPQGGFVALAAFAVLCLVVLSSASRLVEPDDYAYRASILAGFAALEAAVFVRYTDMVVLGCAVVAVVAAWKLRAVALFGLGAWSFAVMHDFWLFPGPAVINGPAWLNAS